MRLTAQVAQTPATGTEHEPRHAQTQPRSCMPFTDDHNVTVPGPTAGADAQRGGHCAGDTGEP